MDNLLTERAFWANYWENKENIAVEIPENYLFHQLIKEKITSLQCKTAIELGGFPGFYAVFLKKYFQIEVDLLDYFIHPPIIEKLLAVNHLKSNDIGVIETDLFKYETEKKYDLVLSCGLIEHFRDTKDILERHVNLMHSQSQLFVTLPNFKSVNGWIQKVFDRENYDKHFIECMDIKLLKETAESLGLTQVSCYYYGGFSVWLENKAKKSRFTKLFVKSIWFTGKVLSKLIPIQWKYAAPYIVLEAIKD